MSEFKGGIKMGTLEQTIQYPRKMTDERREEWKSGLRMELMQTAAMCVRAIVDLKL
jgi:hypothetical protein